MWQSDKQLPHTSLITNFDRGITVNTLFKWRLSLLISLTALVVGSVSAQAETINKTASIDNSPTAVKSLKQIDTLSTDTVVATQTPANIQSTTSSNQPIIQAAAIAPQLDRATAITPTKSITIPAVPVPGKALTSAAALVDSPQNVAQSGTTPNNGITAPSGTTNPSSPGTAPSQTQPNLITPGNAPGPTAPTNNPTDIAPGRSTRGGSSYVGIAGNIGLSGGETALGSGSFTVISKIGLLRNISFRPTAVIGDNTTILLPLTYDFSSQSESVSSKAFRISPYVGGGIAINTGTNSDTGGLITAGVDVPLTPQFTANAALNVGFVNNTSIGLLIGVGYNFSGFFGL